MKDLSTLRNGVIEKITQNGDQKVEAKEQAHARELDSYRAQSEERKSSDIGRITEQVKDQLNQNKQSYDNKKRNELLAVKETILKEVIQAAIDHLRTFDGEEIRPFIDQAVKQIDQNKAHTLIFGDQSIDKVSDETIQQLQADYPQMEISSDSLTRSSGFIIEQDGIEYNYRFEDLVDEIEPELKVEISKEVF